MPELHNLDAVIATLQLLKYNTQIALDEFATGKINSQDLRQAIRSILDARASLILGLHEAGIAEEALGPIDDPLA
jgi:hypothetical protein